MNQITSLPFPADKIVLEFVDGICGIEPEFIDGIYLTGSISLNDFYPEKSDIDFLVLCKKFPDEKISAELKKLHSAVSHHYPKPNLSGCYLLTKDINTKNPENINTLSYYEDNWKQGPLEMAPVTLAELKSNSITVYGADAASLPFSISTDSLKNFLHANINSYWKKWIAQHSKISCKKSLLFLFPRFTEWSVLGVARQLYTLNTGKIISKTEAGYYCLKHLPEKYHSIIQKAIEIRKDDRTFPLVKSYGISPSFTRTMSTIECVNYIIGLFNKKYNEITKQA